MESAATEKISISKGLLMAPNSPAFANLINKHKRAGSTGTTGDESYTTDEEDNVEIDEPDCSIKDHITSKLFNRTNSDFDSLSDIATIADKVGAINVKHRNSSDSSVYSDLGLDKVDNLDTISFLNQDGNSCASGDQSTWGRSVVEMKEQTFARLQNELKEAHQELRLRDEEVNRLSRIRQDVEAELEDLTASLFQVRIEFIF